MGDVTINGSGPFDCHRQEHIAQAGSLPALPYKSGCIFKLFYLSFELAGARFRYCFVALCSKLRSPKEN
jgi:hypothetical protein